MNWNPRNPKNHFEHPQTLLKNKKSAQDCQTIDFPSGIVLEKLGQPCLSESIILRLTQSASGSQMGNPMTQMFR